jgi:hypothetical protein
MFHENRGSRTKFKCPVQWWTVWQYLLQALPHKIALLKCVWHYTGKSRTHKHKTTVINVLVCFLKYLDKIMKLMACRVYERVDKWNRGVPQCLLDISVSFWCFMKQQYIGQLLETGQENHLKQLPTAYHNTNLPILSQSENLFHSRLYSVYHQIPLLKKLEVYCLCYSFWSLLSLTSCPWEVSLGSETGLLARWSQVPLRLLVLWWCDGSFLVSRKTP